MKAKLLTDDESLLTMFRLGGIEGVLVKNTDEARESFNESIADSNLGVLILTTTINGWIKKDINLFKEDETMPLIVTIDG